MECVELAPAVGCVARFESGSQLHSLHTLRAVWFRLCRPGDRRALPAVTDRLLLKPDGGCISYLLFSMRMLMILNLTARLDISEQIQDLLLREAVEQADRHRRRTLRL